MLKDKSKPPHPYDANYGMLKCTLTLLDKKSQEFKYIETYTNQTQGWHKVEILNVWKVEREDEVKRFKMFDSLSNRKLLWHGTSVAVVVAILKTGLRIMPHSGGRVGKGIYFASENGKSAGYVGTTNHNSKNVGIMFLNEVALGKESYITRDDSSLTRPPNGYDCVIARGMTEPG
jgi:poly [ADP-ribose] polymerase